MSSLPWRRRWGRPRHRRRRRWCSQRRRNYRRIVRMHFGGSKLIALWAWEYFTYAKPRRNWIIRMYIGFGVRTRRPCMYNRMRWWHHNVQDLLQFVSFHRNVRISYIYTRKLVTVFPCFLKPSWMFGRLTWEETRL
jgi:hypothetical protein